MIISWRSLITSAFRRSVVALVLALASLLERTRVWLLWRGGITAGVA